MTTILALVGLVQAGAPAAPEGVWPSDVPLVFRFSYGDLFVTVDAYGKAEFLPAGMRSYTWTCRAKPATRAGKQQMTCDEPGLGSIWMMWGPGREILSLDIDEDDAELGDDKHHHRVRVLSGGLELWPTELRPGFAWDQKGQFGALRVAATRGAASFELRHTVSAAEVDHVTITSAGAATLLLSSVSHTDSRVQLGVEGEAVFDGARGLLVERNIRVFPVRYAAGMFGTVGHELTVRLVEQAAP